MKFTKIQDKDTRQITKFLVNNKPVTQKEFDDKHFELTNKGKIYNSSFTTRDKDDNFKHTYYL